MTSLHPLGRIGKLAEDLAIAARKVAGSFYPYPGGPHVCSYIGPIKDVVDLLDRLDDLERYLKDWK